MAIRQGWSQGRKVIKSSILGLVLSTSGASAGTDQIESPGSAFVAFWSQGQKVTKSKLQGMVFSFSGGKTRKSLNRASWDFFFDEIVNNIVNILANNIE